LRHKGSEVTILFALSGYLAQGALRGWDDVFLVSPRGSWCSFECLGFLTVAFIQVGFANEPGKTLVMDWTAFFIDVYNQKRRRRRKIENFSVSRLVKSMYLCPFVAPKCGYSIRKPVLVKVERVLAGDTNSH
jgi:hypothetical protein